MQREIHTLQAKLATETEAVAAVADELAASRAEHVAVVTALRGKLEQDQGDIRMIVSKLIEEKKTVTQRMLAFETALRMSAEQLEAKDQELKEQQSAFEAMVYGTSTAQMEVSESESPTVLLSFSPRLIAMAT